MNCNVFVSTREYSILKILENESGWLSFEEIGIKLGYSYKTIQNDIINLRKILPSEWSICSERGKGIQLEKPCNLIVDYTFQVIEKEEECILFEKLISKPYTLEELEVELYMSKNNILKVVKLLEKQVMKFYLKIEKNPYCIVGHEGFKRLFLFECLSIEGGRSKFYKTDSAEEKKNKIAQFLANKIDIHLTNYGINVLYFFIEISLHRIKEGHIAEDTKDYFNEDVKDVEMFQNLSPFFDLLEGLFDIKFQIYDRAIIYLFIVFSEFQFNDIFRLDWSHMLEKYSDFIEFKVWFEEVMGELNIHTNEVEANSFIRQGFNLYKVNKLRSLSKNLNYFPRNSILIHSKETYAIYVNKIKRIFKAYEKKYGIKLSEASVINFTLLIVNYIKSNRFVQVKVILVSSRSKIIQSVLYNSLLENFQGKAEISSKSILEIEQNHTVISDADIIVTDSLINIETNSEVILIDGFLTSKNISDISHEISNLLELKLENYFN